MPWAKESDESCILELSRRSQAACQWRPTSFRRAIVSEEPFVGSKLQCFHNRMTGFADWAQLFRNEGTGAWYAVLHTQRDASDVARRTFSKREVLRLGELLDRYDEIRVNNADHAGGADDLVVGGGAAPPETAQNARTATTGARDDDSHGITTTTNGRTRAPHGGGGGPPRSRHHHTTTKNRDDDDDDFDDDDDLDDDDDDTRNGTGTKKKKKVPRNFQNWKSADVEACVAEVRSRLGEAVEAGVSITASGEKLTLERGGDYPEAPWVARFANGSTCSLGELLDVYPQLQKASLRSPRWRPPPKRATLESLEDDDDDLENRQKAAAAAAEKQRDHHQIYGGNNFDDDKTAFDLFVPVVAKSRRERHAYDEEATAFAEKIAKEAEASDEAVGCCACGGPPRRSHDDDDDDDEVTHFLASEDDHNNVNNNGGRGGAPFERKGHSGTTTTTTRKQRQRPKRCDLLSKFAVALEKEAAKAAARASRSYFTGVSLRRPADALYDAVLEQKKRQPYHSSPSVAVAFAIARAALADIATAPGAAMDAVSANFFGGPLVVVDDLRGEKKKNNNRDVVVFTALEAARVCLRALYRYHPALFCTTRDVAVAALEACDQAIFGEDADAAKDDDTTPSARDAARELRYCAVIRALAGDDSLPEERPDASEASSSSSSCATSKKSVALLQNLRSKRTARGKLRAMVECLEAITSELSAEASSRVASDDLMPALCDAIRDSDVSLGELDAQLRFAKIFNRDPKLLLGADGYALTSFEIAAASRRQEETTQHDLAAARAATPRHGSHNTDDDGRLRVAPPEDGRVPPPTPSPRTQDDDEVDSPVSLNRSANDDHHKRNGSDHKKKNGKLHTTSDQKKQRGTTSSSSKTNHLAAARWPSSSSVPPAAPSQQRWTEPIKH